MQKMIPILLAAVLLLSLAGCGAGGSETENSAQTPMVVTTDAPDIDPGTETATGEDLETPAAEETDPLEENNNE